MSLVWQLIQSRLLLSKLKCVEAVVTRHVTISRGGLILILNESAADRLSPILGFVVNVVVVVGFVSSRKHVVEQSISMIEVNTGEGK